MKKKILILSGGISKERLISLDTGLQVANELKKNGYKIKITEPDNNLAKIINQFKPNVIFNALHGQFGEDGYIQTILDGFKIPYTHSGAISSSIAMDKEISKKIFISNKIVTPKYIMYSFNKKTSGLIKVIDKKLKFPVVVKPINEGSSVNVFICTKNNIFKKINFLVNYKKIIIEEFIPGREIQAAIIGNKKLKFPVVVKPTNEGSSVNVYICTKKNILKVLDSMKIYKQVMIEKFIAGREIQVAIMGKKNWELLSSNLKENFTIIRLSIILKPKLNI